MSKDKKNEGKEILEEFKELSEWQKRNQEYLKKKAEEEAALAEEKEKERQARMGEESEKSEDQESETDHEDSESAKEEPEEKVEYSEADKEEEEIEESGSKEKEEQDKNLAKKEKPAKAKIPGLHILRALTILFPSLLLLTVSAYLLSPYATMKDIRVEGTVQTTADDIRQASGIQDTDYTINLLLDKAKYEDRKSVV